MTDPTRGSAATFSSAHLARARAQQRAQQRALIFFVLAALCLGAIIGLLVGYTMWGTVEVICGG